MTWDELLKGVIFWAYVAYVAHLLVQQWRSGDLWKDE